MFESISFVSGHGLRTGLDDGGILGLKATETLLSNVKAKISSEQRQSLDKNITLEELEKAVKKLQKGKSPGPDGIPAEFYQVYWDKIKHLYLGFINSVKDSCFPASKNVSITTLIYKNRGEKCSLSNYRPIALLQSIYTILASFQPVFAKMWMKIHDFFIA